MIDYLAAALEQEEPEEEELRVKLNWKEPLWGPVGESADGNAMSPVEPGKTEEAETDQRQGLVKPEDLLWERERSQSQVVDGLEKFLRRRSEATDIARLAKSAHDGDAMSSASVRTEMGAEWDVPLGRRGRELPVSLATALRKARAGTDFVRRERRNLTVTLPEAPVVAGSFSAEELDRAVERDARRYDGGFSLY